jgi:hypothetical protein
MARAISRALSPIAKCRSFPTSPANVANKRDFNGIEVPGLDPNAVEKSLSGFEA